MAPQPEPKDIKVKIYEALHELKMVSTPHFAAAMNQLGNLEHREILGLVAAPPDRVFVQQGRAQMMHEIIQMMVECSHKTKQYKEQTEHGHGTSIGTG